MASSTGPDLYRRHGGRGRRGPHRRCAARFCLPGAALRVFALHRSLRAPAWSRCMHRLPFLWGRRLSCHARSPRLSCPRVSPRHLPVSPAPLCGECYLPLPL